MVPNLEDGDYVIAKRLGPADVITIGDIVEIDHPSLGPIIKMIKSARFGNVQFQGLSVRSTEPDQIGWIPRSRLKARLLCRISPRGLSDVRAGKRLPDIIRGKK